jgi:hypothetical protein
MMHIPSPIIPTIALVLVVAVACTPPSKDGSVPQKAGPASCPEVVAQTVAREFPNATGTRCKAEHVGSMDQYEVRLVRDGAELIVDVAADGRVLQTEAAIPIDQVPVKVMANFSAKYQGVKPTRAEKQVRIGKGVFYELAFKTEQKGREATFAEDGSFIDEE